MLYPFLQALKLFTFYKMLGVKLANYRTMMVLTTAYLNKRRKKSNLKLTEQSMEPTSTMRSSLRRDSDGIVIVLNKLER